MAINYKDLILKAEEEETALETMKKVYTPKPSIEYSIDVSGIDFVVTRKTKVSEQMLIILVSQQQFYIKDMKKANDNITMLTSDKWASFFRDLPTDFNWTDKEGNKVPWIKTLGRSAIQYNCVMKIIADKDFEPWIKNGYICYDFKDKREDDIGNSTSKFNFSLFNRIIKFIPEEYHKEYRNILNDALTSHSGYINRGAKIGSIIDFFKSHESRGEWMNGHYIYREVECPIYKRWGHEGQNQFVKAFFETAVESFPEFDKLNRFFNGESYHVSNKNKTTIDFDLQSFIHYLFYSSVEQGFADDINNFIDLWNDDLSSQSLVYKHGIKDKYPENLASHEKILIYKYNLNKKEYDKQAFEAKAEEMAQYERTGDKYIIKAPTCPDDMIEEARMQSNCLSSYVSRVLKGTCMIFFMRYKNHPDESLVTIEVHDDYSLGQVKAKYNHEPTPEQREYVNKWWKDKFAKKYMGVE